MASNNITLPAPVFTGKNYEIRSVNMKAYDLWEVVETSVEPPPLQENPTVVSKLPRELTLLPFFTLL